MDCKKIRSRLFALDSERAFNELALELYAIHSSENPLYASFVAALQRPTPTHYLEIPSLPISFFKKEKILLPGLEAVDFFRSSGTGGEQSHHYIADFSLYEESFRRGFAHFMGDPRDYCILALLPNYITQGHSSLVYMLRDLIAQSDHADSGFYLDDLDGLAEVIRRISDRKILLFGVSYALLDLVERHRFADPRLVVFETGGMKGRRKEMSKSELHRILCEGFGCAQIYSEYGMTELFSQAYSQGNGRFKCPPWMKVVPHKITDPLAPEVVGRMGILHILDLANIHSCPFIATEDLGKSLPDGVFEVLGRVADSDLRGCNLMVE